MKSKLEAKKEILEKLLDEIEDLKKEVREEIKETRAYQANKLLEKYKDDMLKISELGKQQETIYKKYMMRTIRNMRTYVKYAMI